MNPKRPTPPPQAARDDTDEISLPCATALLAATLALMTGHAAPTPEASVGRATLQRLTARKIVSNLFFLQQHPHLPPGLRQVASQLHGRWWPLAHADDAPTAGTEALRNSGTVH